MSIANSILSFKSRDELINQRMDLLRIRPRLGLQMLEKFLITRIELHSGRQARQIVNPSLVPNRILIINEKILTKTWNRKQFIRRVTKAQRTYLFLIFDLMATWRTSFNPHDGWLVATITAPSHFFFLFDFSRTKREKTQQFLSSFRICYTLKPIVL